ncbi:MAG: CBS domain-containing protein, partial [Clostridiales bacterium]|nr:CBS domain-containing protein [Clostridiales bacterium]
LGGRHSRYPVEIDGAVVGIVSLSDAKKVPRDEWPVTRAVDVADRDLGRLVVDSRAPVESILQRLSGESTGALLVVDEGRVVGIVTRADVVSRVRRASI